MQIKGVKFQSPGRSDLSRDDSNMGDDSSSMGAKEEDEDDENDEDLEDNSGDPERLKAFNVRHFYKLIMMMKMVRRMSKQT